MGILDGKRILITGVLTDASIAFHVARIAQLEGATVVLTGFGRLSLVERIAKRLPEPPPVLELDVTDEAHLGSLAERVAEHVDGLDGVVHAIANAPGSAMGGNFLHTPWPEVASAVHVSAYSLKSLDGRAAAHEAGRLDRWPGLRCERRLAGLRLDGRSQGRAGVHRPLPRARPRAEGDPGQPDLRRAGQDDGGAEHPRLRPVRRGVGGAGAPWLGPVDRRARRARLRGAAVGLVSGDDG